MTNKEKYRRAFGVLHASEDILTEVKRMETKKHFSLRKAVLLFAAAAREWWFKGVELDRSRSAAGQISASEISAAARESSGEVETVRRLRQAHPGLRLVDAVNLVRDQKSSDA